MACLNPSVKLAARTIARSASVLLLCVSSYWAMRLAWADRLSREPNSSARERAFQLAPLPVFADRLAQAQEEQGRNSLPLWRQAAALDPENPERLMRLGLQAELAGDFALAEYSLLAAAARSRLYQPKYLLAQYYFRRQNAGRFWPWARGALQTAPGDAAPLFDLAWRLQPDAPWLSANAIPPRREIRRQYLAWLAAHQEWPAAAAEAASLLPAADQADRPGLLAYCEALLARGDAAGAMEVWNALSRRHLIPDQALDPVAGRLVTNPDFRHPPTGSGFDWRLAETYGVHARAANGALQIEFTGSQPEHCAIAWQYVPAAPGARYRLSFAPDRAGSLPAPEAGMAWEVPGASALEKPAGPSGAVLFQGGPAPARILLTYRRPPGAPRLEGTVAITGARLERAP